MAQQKSGQHIESQSHGRYLTPKWCGVICLQTGFDSSRVFFLYTYHCLYTHSQIVVNFSEKNPHLNVYVCCSTCGSSAREMKSQNAYQFHMYIIWTPFGHLKYVYLSLTLLFFVMGFLLCFKHNSSLHYRRWEESGEQ